MPPKTKSAAGLTPRQERFVAEYLIDLNAKQAAIRAGYSAKTAEVQGCRLLRNAQVVAAVIEGKDKRSAATGITQERVLRELEALAFSRVDHFVVGDDGTFSIKADAHPDAIAAVASVKHRITTNARTGEITREVDFKLWDKPSTLKLAGRHTDTRGFFEKIEVTGKDGGPIAMKVVRTSDEKRARAAQLIAEARKRAGSQGGAPNAGESH